MAKRGRPELSNEEAALVAANIIETATALRYYPDRFFTNEGVNKKDAISYIFGKRHRGKIGQFVGDALDGLFPKENKTQLAVSWVLDHGLSTYSAGRLLNLDATSLGRAVRVGWDVRSVQIFRVKNLRTVVSDVD